MTSVTRATLLQTGLLMLGLAFGGNAAAYPDRPVKVVVAFAPGGIADQAVRAVADKLGAELGQPVVIENRGGAGGNIAAALVAKSPADGYTLLATTTSIAANPALYRNTGYDIGKDFAPIVQLASSPNAIAANPGVGVKTLQEAIEKSRGAKNSFGSPGNGSTSHLTGEYLFNTLSKAGIAHVAYKGGALAVADALGGQTQFVVVPVSVLAQHVKAGTLTPLAVTSRKRYADWPQVPTVGESGFPGYEDATWVGVFAPAGTPADVVDQLNARINAVLNQPDVQRRLDAVGLQGQGGSAADFGEYVGTEAAKWKKIVRQTGIEIE
ncbi:MAG: tripartite tricarboxylate transporter substrate binding protein [Burkholderiaceae bacterium]